MRIVLVVNSLVQGGAQRFTIGLANSLANSHEVTLITFYPKKTDFFEIPSSVKVLRFINPFQDNGRTKGFWSRSKVMIKIIRIILRIKDLLHLRKMLVDEQPDVVIAIERMVGTLVALLVPKGIKVIFSERVHPEFHKVPTIFGLFDPLVRRKAFKRKNVYLHAQGVAIARSLRNEFRKSVTVIPNFVPVKDSLPISSKESQDKVVLSVGRFSYQKGFDLLLEAWALIPNQEKEDWTLRIIGDGDIKPFIEIASRLSILDSVQLESASRDIESAYINSDIFVLASRYEGFPNALAEAMSFGLPSIVTDCPSAIRDLTKDGALAKLVDLNAQSLADSLREFMANPDLRREFGKASLKVLDFFSEERITVFWKEFISFVNLDNSKNEQKCPICFHSQKRKSVVDLKTKSQILQDLSTQWNIHAPNSSVTVEMVLRYRCNICGVHFFNASAGDRLFYEACHNSKQYVRSSRWDYLKVMEFFGKDELNSMSILDVGSGASRFIGLQSNTVERLSIVEIDQDVVNKQSEQIRMAFSDITEVIGNYDLIIISHYLEHVDNPNDFVAKLAKICLEKSFLAVTVPDAIFNEESDSILDWPPHHTLRFTQESIDLLFSKHKFKRIARFYQDPSSNTGFDFLTIYRFLGN